MSGSHDKHVNSNLWNKQGEHMYLAVVASYGPLPLYIMGGRFKVKVDTQNSDACFFLDYIMAAGGMLSYLALKRYVTLIISTQMEIMGAYTSVQMKGLQTSTRVADLC
jgi:hypothetical protein